MRKAVLAFLDSQRLSLDPDRRIQLVRSRLAHLHSKESSPGKAGLGEKAQVVCAYRLLVPRICPRATVPSRRPPLFAGRPSGRMYWAGGASTGPDFILMVL